jgi:hypothetical protein
MFKDKMKAIDLCVSRFDTETKATFLDLYTKIDAEAIENLVVDDATDAVKDEDSEPEAFDDYTKPDETVEAF